MTISAPAAPSISFARLLTARRLRAQAIVLALCVWSVCAIDFATPGLFDRAGNIKFQDFLPFYISASLIHEGHADQLYDDSARNQQMLAILSPHEVHDGMLTSQHPIPQDVRLPNLYPPQVGLLFVPLIHFSFLTAAAMWVTISLLAYFICIFFIWKSCSNLYSHGILVSLCTFAFAPLFHFFVRAQISVLILACFSAAFLLLRGNRPALAGIVLGVLAIKPQFLVAIPLILVIAGAGRILTGLIFSSAAQFLFADFYSKALMSSYLELFLHPSRWVGTAELSLAPIQMHSLRSFWSLLIPSPVIALTLYIVTSLLVIAITAAIWRSAAPIAVRFSALILAAVLVNPHLFVYDLLVLAPVFLLLVDWSLERHPSSALHSLLWLAFVLPLFGPISRWTHVQVSVIAFAALLWTLHAHTNSQSPRTAVATISL